MCALDQQVALWDGLVPKKRLLPENHSKKSGPEGWVLCSLMGLSSCVPSGLAEGPEGTCVCSQQVLPPKAEANLHSPQCVM